MLNYSFEQTMCTTSISLHPRSPNISTSRLCIYSSISTHPLTYSVPSTSSRMVRVEAPLTINAIRMITPIPLLNTHPTIRALFRGSRNPRFRLVLISRTRMYSRSISLTRLALMPHHIARNASASEALLALEPIRLTILDLSSVTPRRKTPAPTWRRLASVPHFGLLEALVHGL
jgi:hypothetical protein